MNRYLRREQRMAARDADWRAAAHSGRAIRDSGRANTNLLIDQQTNKVFAMPKPAPTPKLVEGRKAIIDQETGRIVLIRHFYMEVV